MIQDGSLRGVINMAASGDLHHIHDPALGLPGTKGQASDSGNLVPILLSTS